MKLGGLDISTVKLGASQVQAIYQGQNLVWQNAPVATAATGVGQTSFTANWEAYTGATYYLLDVSESSDFSTFIYQNQIVEAPNTSYVVIGLNSNTTYYYRVRASDDADSLGFFQRVNIAGGTLTSTEQIAIIELVQDLKDYGVWEQMKAIYPMVGASAEACKQNLKSSSFTGTFYGGWTFASNGVTPNGTNAYMDSGFNPTNDTTSINYGGYGYYYYGVLLANKLPLFAGFSPYWGDYPISSTSMAPSINSEVSRRITVVASTDGFNQFSRTSSSEGNYRYNDNFYVGDQNTSALINKNIYIAAANYPSGAVGFFDKRLSFVYLADSQFTPTDQQNIRTAVLNFNTTLGR